MPNHTPGQKVADLEAQLKEARAGASELSAKARASELLRELDLSRREIKTAREEAAQVGPLKAQIADLNAELTVVKKDLAEANRARSAAELKLKAKPEKWLAAVEEAEAGGLQYDRDDLQGALPDGWRLIHFRIGGERGEKYTAAKDEAGATQSASAQAELIRRCEGWEAEQASRVPVAAPVAAEKPSKPAGVKRGAVAA